jgi:hypothetical protein
VHTSQNDDKQRKNTTLKTKNMKNSDTIKKSGVNPSAREGLSVHVSYKTHVMLLIVKSSKRLVGDKGKNKSK